MTDFNIQSKISLLLVVCIAYLTAFLPRTCGFSAAEAEESPVRGRTQNYTLRIVPAPGEVNVDGIMDDWDRSGRIFACDDLENQRDRKSAEIMGMYDDNALYLAAEVSDPTPLKNTVDPEENPQQGWKGDCLQVRFMFEKDKPRRIYWVDSWFFRPKERPVLRIQKREPEEIHINGLEEGAEAAFRVRDGGAGYVQEIRIPWRLLGVDSGKVEPGFRFRMGVEVIGGEKGEPSSPFHIRDLVARRGEKTDLFFIQPERWGKTKLYEDGDLELANFETMPVEREEHPFLICSRDQFNELRERAKREPWKTMKEKAMERVEEGMPEGDSVSPQALNRFIGACALAYITAPNRAEHYAGLVKRTITEGLAGVEFDPTQDWRGTVPPMGAAFMAIIGLDIVYNDLAKEEIQACEEIIEKQINKIDREGAWPAARYGTHGTWDVYRGERIVPDDAFYETYLQQMTDDGVSTVSPTYAFARLGSSDGRLQKTAYADVLEFTGIDQRYYDNPKLEKFYRFLFGYCVDPARQYYLFGDVFPYASPGNSALFWRVGRFDDRAAEYAAWLLKDKKPPGHIMSFVLMEEPMPHPLIPGSRLFDEGGAVMREEPDRPESAGAMLYNIAENAEWHTNEETNGISISAFGNRLLVNGGWLGEETRPPWRNNTITINRERHESRTGEGLEEGLLSDRFGYACGDSGDALGNGRFSRSLVLVHRSNGVGPYFVIFDEVEATPGDTIQLYLQTASEDAPRTVEEKKHFDWDVNHHAEVDGVRTTSFFTSPPQSVEFDLVPSGLLERTEKSGRHYRIEAEYEAGKDGQKRMSTVLFPHNEEHPLPDIRRISEDGFSGAVVKFESGGTDLLLQPSDGETINHQDLTFHGRTLIRRRDGEGMEFYFARQATEFIGEYEGFESSDPVSIFMRGNTGTVRSEKDVELTIYNSELETVLVDGEVAEIRDSGEGWRRIHLPGGKSEIRMKLTN